MFAMGPAFFKTSSGGSIDPTAASIYGKLVAWWACDDASGTTIKDYHIHGVDLTMISGSTIGFGATTVRSGGSRSAAFTTSNAGANSSTTLDAYISGANDHACFAWYRPTAKTSGSGARFIFGQYDGSSGVGPSSTNNDQIGLYIDNSGYPNSFWRYSSSSTAQAVASTRSVATGTNTFIGYNKLTSVKKIEHWKDGSSETPISYANEPTGSSRNTQVSCMKGQVGFYAGGAEQEVTLFNTSLTSTEIAWLYNAGAGVSYAALKSASGH